MEKISVAVRFRPLASSCDSDSGRKWQISDKVISLCHFNTPVSGLTFSFGIFLSPPTNHKLSLTFLFGLSVLPDVYTYFFNADHVFDQSSSNVMVYNVLIKSIITAAIDGFNGNF